ncbi:hypothetical protein VTK73DRAFT_4359 [Phialemonium thermophilum]|uniref:Uncharacterized protein n=1 Tax=Phialemonium thermophilum TaxID=223376 RepID=A0ABR3V9K4_9PEZI
MEAAPGSRFRAHEVSTAGHFWTEKGTLGTMLDAVRTFAQGVLGDHAGPWLVRFAAASFRSRIPRVGSKGGNPHGRGENTSKPRRGNRRLSDQRRQPATNGVLRRLENFHL